MSPGLSNLRPAMGELWGVIATAVAAFVGTNVDDAIVLAVLFAASRTMGRPQCWQVWSGQYLGIGALVVVSIVAALGLTIVPDEWVGLLGLVALGLGVRGLIETARVGHNDEPVRSPQVATGVAAVAAVTIANGADNIAIYTPLFRTMDSAEVAITVAVFAGLVAVWCGAGMLLGARRHVTAAVERWGHWIVPAMFVLIGGFIVIESHVLTHLADLV